MTYVKKIIKNAAVPIKDCLVDTGSSFGTGMNEKMSIFVNSLIGRGYKSGWMKDYLTLELVSGWLISY